MHALRLALLLATPAIAACATAPTTTSTTTSNTTSDVDVVVSRGSSSLPVTLVVAAARVASGGVVAFEVRWTNTGTTPRALHFGACATPLAQLRNDSGRVDVVIGEGGGGIGSGLTCTNTPVDVVVAPGEHVARAGQIAATTRTTSPFANPPVPDHVEPLPAGTYQLEVSAPRTDGAPGTAELLTADIIVE